MGRKFGITIQVPELDQALSKIKMYDGKASLGVEEAISSAVKNIGKGARRRVAVDSGRLKKSIRTRFTKKTLTGVVAARAPYAHLVEFGAKPATVKPKKGKALAIDEFGIRRYAGKANIPQRMERPYMRPSYEEEKPNLIRRIKEAVKP